MRGRIIKGIAGFYYVFAEPAGKLFECKAKGIFRKDRLKPLIGDQVEIEILDEQEQTGNITRLYPRRNALIRPQVANIDQAMLVFALIKPIPNFLMLDKLLLQYKRQEIPVLLCFNKEDLVSETEVFSACGVYKNSGCALLVTSVKNGEGIEELRTLLTGKTTSVAGPSGVGKSSLINCLQTDVKMETGSISKKADRGKHTTRHSEIIRISEDTYIMDTPGFSSFDVFGLECGEVADYYKEFADFRTCRFQPCSHTHEPDCGVKEAVAAGKINPSRYEGYVQIYKELKEQRRY
ncbi:MAG: ribosome small subunit-dependent GTPase A [Lachnospiraceae bacterium]